MEAVNELQKEVLANKLIKTLGSSDEEQPPQSAKLSPAGIPSNPAQTTCARPLPTIIERLLVAGATVRAHDPEALNEAKKYFGNRIEYSTNQYEILDDVDALTVITDWHEYRNPDFDRIKAALKQPLIVDKP